MKEIITAPYGTMRVVYTHYDMGNKGKMQYYDRKTNSWRTVAYYPDYAAMMMAYHNEIAMHH